MIAMSSPTINAPASCWSESAEKPCGRSPAPVDAGVQRRSHDHEAHPEEHPDHPRGEEVPDLPQATADPAPLGLERRPPDEHPRADEARVLRRVQPLRAHRALERRGEVPAVEHGGVDRQRHQRAAYGAKRLAQPPLACQRDQGGPGMRNASTGLRIPASRRGAPRSAISRCSAMCAESSPSPSELSPEPNAITHSPMPACHNAICVRGTRTPRRARIRSARR